MKFLLLALILLLSTNVFAEKAYYGHIQARCAQWSHILNFNEEIINNHFVNSNKTLNRLQIAYQAGVAEGIVLDFSINTNKSKKDVAYMHYMAHCMKSINEDISSIRKLGRKNYEN